MAEYDVRAMAADDEYAKWWSTSDSGAVIDLDKGDGQHGDDGDESSLGFSSSFWDGDARMVGPITRTAAQPSNGPRSTARLV